MKAYLDMSSLCDYISCSRSYIKKKIEEGTFKKGVHYVQPDGPGGKLKFIRVEIDKWMQKDEPQETQSLAQIMAQKLLAS